MVSACFNQSSTKNGVDEILEHIQPHYVRRWVALCWGKACDTARSPGKGVEKAGCQQGPWTEMKTVVINPKQLFFCGRIFHRIFRCVFRCTFRRTFSLHFSPHLSPGPSLQIVLPENFHSCHNKASMSNEVAQYR